MDVQRQGVKKRKMIRWTIFGVLFTGALGGATYGVRQLKPALPSVDGGTVWPDTVKRGPMLRQVHGLGSLVPEEAVWISAVTGWPRAKTSTQPVTRRQP